MKVGLQCIIKGRVQGVMFRDFVQRKARSLDVVGTVENVMDGSVLVIAVGEKENLQKLLEFLQKGPLLTRISIRIDDVQVKWEDATKDFPDFKITY